MITKVSASQEVTGICRKKDAWRQLIDIMHYPERIPIIDTVRIRERDDVSVLSEWFISLDGAPFSWIECDTFMPEHYRYNFRAVSGDFDLYRGYWKIDDSDSGTLVLTTELEYVLGIPVIEENLGTVLKRKMEHFLNVSVAGQCRQLAGCSTDERNECRLPVNHALPLHLDGHATDAEIINLSSRGMMFKLKRGMFNADENKERAIILSGCPLKGFISAENGRRVHRVQFTDALSETLIGQLLHTWNNGNMTKDPAVLICDVIKGKPLYRRNRSSPA